MGVGSPEANIDKAMVQNGIPRYIACHVTPHVGDKVSGKANDNQTHPA
jgi:hypothetical protein